MTGEDLTSDILIYNILQNSDDEFIQKCNIKFIDRSVPAEEDDTIYVASIDCEHYRETFDHTQYRALVNVYVKTKDTDYVEGSRFLRTVIRHIKYVLKSNSECKERNITFRNIKYEYGSSYTLKGMHLLIQLLENEEEISDKDYTCVSINTDEFDIIED